jgi:hypothetical protein
LVIGEIGLFADGAQAAETLYELSPGIPFQEGCVRPCLCPITLPEEMTWTFLLVPAGSDPLLTNYQLNEIDWTVLDPNGKVAHEMTRQGTYKLGCEVALMQPLGVPMNEMGFYLLPSKHGAMIGLSFGF